MIIKFKIFEGLNLSDMKLIYPILKDIRSYFIKLNRYSDLGLSGVCGEASKKILYELKKIGYESELISGDFLINEDLWKLKPTGVPKPVLTNHVWVETNGYLIDVTHDQYSEAIEEKLPDIVFDKIENCPRYVRNEDEFWQSCERLNY